MPYHGRLPSGKYRRRRSQLVRLRMALFGLARRIVLRRSFGRSHSLRSSCSARANAEDEDTSNSLATIAKSPRLLPPYSTLCLLCILWAYLACVMQLSLSIPSYVQGDPQTEYQTRPLTNAATLSRQCSLGEYVHARRSRNGNATSRISRRADPRSWPYNFPA